jgi:hypothetical protein
MTESDIITRYEAMRALLFGAILDAVSVVLRESGRVEQRDLPRMADFAHILRVLDVSAPQLTGGGALQAYLAQGGERALEVVDADSVARAILRVLEQGPWEGTPTELFERLKRLMEKDDLPRNPQQLSGHLRRLAPSLAVAGVDFTTGRTGSRRTLRLARTSTA